MSRAVLARLSHSLCVVVLAAACGPGEAGDDEPWPVDLGNSAVLAYAAIPALGADELVDWLGFESEGFDPDGWWTSFSLDPDVYGGPVAFTLPVADEAALLADLETWPSAVRDGDHWRLSLSSGYLVEGLRFLAAFETRNSGPLSVLRSLAPLATGDAAPIQFQLDVGDGFAVFASSFEARGSARRLARRIPGLATAPGPDAPMVFTILPVNVHLAYAELIDAAVTSSRTIRRLSSLGDGEGDTAAAAAGFGLAAVEDLARIGPQVRALQWVGDAALLTDAVVRPSVLRVIAVPDTEVARFLSALRPAIPLGSFSGVLGFDVSAIDTPATGDAVLTPLRDLGFDSDAVARLPSLLEWWSGDFAVDHVVDGGTLDSAVFFSCDEGADVDLDGLSEVVASFAADADAQVVTAPDGRRVVIDGEGETVASFGRWRSVVWLTLGEAEAWPSEQADAFVAAVSAPRESDGPVVEVAGWGADVVVERREGELRITSRSRADDAGR